MKKFVAVLLCVAMLMVGVVAQAEIGYTTTKSWLDDSIGTGVSAVTGNEVDNFLWIMFDFDDYSIFMTGTNSAGKQEGTLWYDLDATTFVYALCNILTGWGVLDDLLDSDYSLVVALTIDEDPIFVDTEEEAEEILEIFNN